MMAAKIISPVIDSSYTSGYNWCIEQVKASQYMDLAHSLDIDKAIGFLKQKDFQQVSATRNCAVSALVWRYQHTVWLSHDATSGSPLRKTYGVRNSSNSSPKWPIMCRVGR